ncbi:MAG: hypothetical protein UW27_C0010G0039 [Parcubacteria group bacterium GW2011_GWA1_44_13]|nr:MAG: hypothetical protein UW27_C0010G0039 [Parcubacteria group bacterium GW2011_GWA1_44_13]
MKKFMLFVLVALFAGCATDNPHYKNAQTIGGTVVGAYTGYKWLKGGILGGLAGAAVGHEVAKGAQWKPGDDEIIYLDAPAGYSSGYSSCGAVAVYCDTTPKQGMYPPRPGMCNAPDSGGEATYEDLVRRAQRRSGCYDNSGHRAQPQYASQQPAVQVVYPPNLFERPEKKQKVAVERPAGVVVGPTVGNYRDERMIHPSCKTGNYGADGVCLGNLVKGLMDEQGACEGKETNGAVCPKGYNPGKWAGIYKRLSNDLSLRQREEQGGELTLR